MSTVFLKHSCKGQGPLLNSKLACW